MERIMITAKEVRPGWFLVSIDKRAPATVHLIACDGKEPQVEDEVIIYGPMKAEDTRAVVGYARLALQPVL
jgi:hypothetical protein